MKKIIIYLFILSTVLVSCESESTGNISKVTNYPNFTLNGEEVVYLQNGESYNDPGVIVTENGVEIPYEVTVSGKYRGGKSLNTNTDDIYTISYSAVNKDGFVGAISRTVIVSTNSDLTNSITGLYTSTVVRNGSTGAQYTDMEYILVWANPDGTYEMSDGIGGYYAIGRGYGDNYLARPVIITANDESSNDYEPIPPFGVGAFGGVATMADLNANPSNNTLSYTTTWDAGYTFVVTLTKINL